MTTKLTAADLARAAAKAKHLAISADYHSRAHSPRVSQAASAAYVAKRDAQRAERAFTAQRAQ